MEHLVVGIKNYLPHRPPMLMVDEILEITQKEVTTVFHIKKDNLFVQDGIFMESGLIENAAQTCSAIVAQPLFLDDKNFFKKDLKLIGFISAIKNLNIIALPKSNSDITTKAMLLSRFDTEEFAICTMKCITFEKNKLLFEAEINLFIQEVKS
jgi:3-hydroxyacyl-[acyl-carrier-protein] dehydratase